MHPVWSIGTHTVLDPRCLRTTHHAKTGRPAITSQMAVPYTHAGEGPSAHARTGRSCFEATYTNTSSDITTWNGR